MDSQRDSYAILIVDDEKNVLSSLKRVLKKEPYKTFTAINAEDGLKILEKQKIDLVISDYLMPKMTGIDLFRKIQFLYPETLRIMLTGKAGYKEAILAINEGLVYRFLTKPWDNEELKLTLRLALQHKQSQEDLQMAQLELHEKNQALTKTLAQVQELHLVRMIDIAGIVNQRIVAV